MLLIHYPIIAVIFYELFKIFFPDVERRAKSQVFELKNTPILEVSQEELKGHVRVCPGQKVAVNGKVVIKTPYSKEYILYTIINLFYWLLLIWLAIVGVVEGEPIYYVAAIGVHAIGSLIFRNEDYSLNVNRIRLDAILSISVWVMLIAKTLI